MAMASRAWSSASKKGAQPSLELQPLFSAFLQEGQRSGRDKYDLDFGFGLGSLCKTFAYRMPAP
jgi:hypothetical protein